jgi:cytochrome c-type biogenesis protein CcmE
MVDRSTVGAVVCGVCCIGVIVLMALQKGDSNLIKSNQRIQEEEERKKTYAHAREQYLAYCNRINKDMVEYNEFLARGAIPQSFMDDATIAVKGSIV